MTQSDTPEVPNQSPPYADVDLYGGDRALQEAVMSNGAEADGPALGAFGRRWGSAAMFDMAQLANEFPPRLKTFDAKGRRSDTVEFHQAYHRFMTESISAGLHASTWQPDATRARAPAEVVRAARFYMVAQVENGHMCPVTMTRAAVAGFGGEASLVKMLMPKLMSRHYDPMLRPWREKIGITLGMGMTEKQGGTDVRSNTTRAEPDGDAYRITGHKWFMSAPMCDAFLVLAQAPGGLTCFFLPRFTPDGHINGLRFQRLKDKLGNRSNASSEVEFDNAYALKVGDEGAGIRTILPMVQLTRLDCAISSAGMMRAAVAQAMHHCRHRSVFGKPLAEQPMMRTVLADMALEVEGAVASVMRLCRSFDLGATSPTEAARARLLTPAIKYAVCKTAPALVYEAMECLGGNGYVEELSMARLYREAPVNAIWEGSGNVMSLDVLRAFGREREAASAVIAELAREAKSLPGAPEAAEWIVKTLTMETNEAAARAATERLAQLAAAAALAAGPAGKLAATYARTRLRDGRLGATYGTAGLDAAETLLVINRILPA
ncbi:acyl-CoA dehydrogenase family protein [Rhodoplanes sp. Z2-YC6860]|uniref:acyl-CoA dehydrogenase family protein n=1 Tax=Rhodoplanes sp. Z2-YC6860 TaxID=674703 RepID=UPI00078E041A|nr:acyl-CoA dehydrogenase family protein [Rhodoplanes sp. Z2-YC6860]AMN42436.1 acyl-CoA dehydrogenase [Rhodoplanes sp. Z2-YC6860]